MLNQKELLEMFNYEPTTGTLTWKIKINNQLDIGSIAGTKNSNGYYIVCINKKRHLVHRIIWTMINGNIPDGMQIDHINHARDDNKLSNLRLVTICGNSHNRKINSNNTTGVVGVYFDKARNRWISQINVNNKQIHLGRFIKRDDAIVARAAANIKYGFHENHGL